VVEFIFFFELRPNAGWIYPWQKRAPNFWVIDGVRWLYFIEGLMVFWVVFVQSICVFWLGLCYNDCNING